MIEPRRIEQVAEILRRAGLQAQTLAALREAFPDLHFTQCLDDDIGEARPPFHADQGFNLYLVDGRGHCLQLTSDPAAATGLLLAEVTDAD